MKDDVLGAVSFLTIFGRGHPPTGYSRYWFALSGAIVGLVSGSVWWLLGKLNLHLLDAGLVVLSVLIVTGAIHLDGLADSADGLLAHLRTARRFEVMSSPEVGVFAVTAVVMSLILQTAALSVLRPNPLFLIGLMGLTRTLCGLAIEVLPYAKAEGIVSAFNNGSRKRMAGKLVLMAESLVFALLVEVSMPQRAFAVLIVACAIQALVLWRGKGLLGGYTGDVLGASITASETVAFVVAALIQR